MPIVIHLDAEAFEPSEKVTGRVEWDGLERRPELLLISLLWYTEGKGTEDIQVVDDVKVVHPAPLGNHEFSLQLPDFPWSFSGTLVSLVWAVEVTFEPRGAVERVNLVAAPGGEEIRL